MGNTQTWYCGRCLTSFEGELSRCPNLGCRSTRPPGGWGRFFDSGDIIDRHYRISQRLATGGGGVTYLARELDSENREIGPKLAIKVLYANRDHGAYLRRLSQEAQILQELAHPHIVEYRGFVDRSGHTPYLITRFEHGGSLSDYVRNNGPMGVQQVAGVGCQILEALERAHRAGVIHRDLKPGNVLLTHIPAPGETPTVKVADFGIAKVAAHIGDGLTRVGTFVGTPQFAAPEQFDGLPPTPATDVFAAGMLLLFCMKMQTLLPLAERMAPEEARSFLLQKLPPSLDLPQQRQDLVSAMEGILGAAMAPEPEDRLNVAHMIRLMSPIAQGMPAENAGRTMVPADNDAVTTVQFLYGNGDAMHAPTSSEDSHTGITHSSSQTITPPAATRETASHSQPLSSTPPPAPPRNLAELQGGPSQPASGQPGTRTPSSAPPMDPRFGPPLPRASSPGTSSPPPAVIQESVAGTPTVPSSHRDLQGPPPLPQAPTSASSVPPPSAQSSDSAPAPAAYSQGPPPLPATFEHRGSPGPDPSSLGNEGVSTLQSPASPASAPTPAGQQTIQVDEPPLSQAPPDPTGPLPPQPQQQPGGRKKRSPILFLGCLGILVLLVLAAGGGFWLLTRSSSTLADPQDLLAWIRSGTRQGSTPVRLEPGMTDPIFRRDYQRIKNRISQAGPRIAHTCSLRGSVGILIQMDPGGSVTSAEVLETIPDKVAICLENEFGKLNFRLESKVRTATTVVASPQN